MAAARQFQKSLRVDPSLAAQDDKKAAPFPVIPSAQRGIYAERFVSSNSPSLQTETLPLWH
jgi:hypothetical protein